MNRKRTTALIGALMIPVVAGGFLLQAKGQREGAVLLDQVMSLVGNNYVDTLPLPDVYEKAAAGLVKELNDPYSELLTPKDLKQFNSHTNGRYGGLGMLIQQDPDTKQLLVVTVYPNSPAEEAGIRENDRIVKVGTLSTQGWTINQVSDSLLGTPGTKVNVTFGRPGVSAPIAGTFIRREIHIPAVAYTLSLGNKIGYIPLQQFNENAAENTAAALKDLQAKGARGIIIDLRGDPGGILTESLEIANMFLQPGQQIASVKGREGAPQVENAKATPIAPTIPLVILTDERSASASEIVTGALQDHDRALVVGQTSFGKGLVQGIYNLDGGYALKLTTGKWFTPSGRSIQRPRKFVNGQFVEEKVDTNETNATKTKRPAFKSDAGRVIYGGGGITPDVIVQDDTLSTAEQTFTKAMAPKSQDFFTVLQDYAIELSKTATPTFTVQPAWVNEFYNRLQAKGVVVDRKTYDGANRYVTRALDQRVAHYAFGDSTAKRRDLPYDAPLRKAIDLLDKGASQRDLFALASTTPARVTAAPKKP
ncbi:MAG: carboxyl-terminal protease [Gemmatimonadetes bacterium]|nr:carboxyl-terminal protease [Gemmatimonadota bacterium]